MGAISLSKAVKVKLEGKLYPVHSKKNSVVTEVRLILGDKQRTSPDRGEKDSCALPKSGIARCIRG